MSVDNKRVPAKSAITCTDDTCRPVREVLSLVGDKWSILIVVILANGTRRFSELQKSIDGISQRMLTRTLRELEWMGLLMRRVEPTVPPSVYYTLTPLGETLLKPVQSLATWATQNYPEIEAAKKRFDRRRL